MQQQPVHTLTTEQIQKYLDENEQLIFAIIENQQRGRTKECQQFEKKFFFFFFNFLDTK